LIKLNGVRFDYGVRLSNFLINESISLTLMMVSLPMKLMRLLINQLMMKMVR